MSEPTGVEFQIAIFASGKGSNAANIIQYFQGHPVISIKLVVCNNPKAEVIKKAEDLGVATLLISREELENPHFSDELKKKDINFIVLAGFLRLIPTHLIRAFKGRIINIHPALLPKYGGKGMYGQKVHRAVLNAGEGETGFSIHAVTENYDEGAVLFQTKCKIASGDTPEAIEAKVRQLELEHYPRFIEGYLMTENFS